MTKRKEIKPVTFSNGKVTPPEIRKVEVPEPINHNKKVKPMRKVIRWIGKTVAGENKLGETVHGFLDLAPVPNQIFAKIASYLLSGNTSEARKELNKLLSVRNIVAFATFLLVVTGVVTIETAAKLLEAIGDFL